MKCRLPMKIGTPSGGGGEIGSAIIMVGEFGTYSDLPSVKVNDTTYTTAQTIEVEQGTEVTVAAIAYNSNTSLIYHDGVQVGSTTYSITQYKFTFTSTVTITSTYHSNNGTYDIYRIDITSEGSSGGGTTPSEYALTIKSGSRDWPEGLLTITVNGTNYTYPTTLALASGTEVSVQLPANTSTISIWHNGTRVDNGAAKPRTYTFTLTEDTTISALEANNQVVITGS